MTTENNTPPAAPNDDPNNPVVPSSSDDEIMQALEIEFSNMTPREKLIAQGARRQEKKKLYGRLRDQKNSLADLQKQVKDLTARINVAPPAGTGNGNSNPNPAIVSDDARVQALQQQIQTLAGQMAQTNENIQRMTSATEKRERQAELRAFRNEVIADLRAEGREVIDSLVVGDSEEEIEQNLKIAEAEYKYQAAKIEEKLRKEMGAQPPSAVNIHQNAGRPTGAPPAVRTGTVESEPAIDNAQLNEVVSDDAVRDGTYEKHRGRLLGQIKRGYRHGAPA
jgi:hypothetical protein